MGFADNVCSGNLVPLPRSVDVRDGDLDFMVEIGKEACKAPRQVRTTTLKPYGLICLPTILHFGNHPSVEKIENYGFY